MVALYRALSAELLKTKRTLTVWLTLLAPLSMMMLVLALYFQQSEQRAHQDDLWLMLIRTSLVLWSLLMLPLFITLETGLLSALEHHNKTWKQLYALPVPRWTVYASKQVIVLGLIGLSMIVLAALTVSVGLSFRVIKPDWNFSAPIPWTTLAQSVTLAYLASWLIISLHLWVSARWPSFVVAMGVGIVTTVAGVIFINSDWAQVYPWTLPGWAARGCLEGEAFAVSLALGFVGGIAIALAGGWDVSRRDVL
jgi:hypothetical protein